MNIERLIIETLKSEVLPAMGCTEPVAVALASAKAKELLEYDIIDEVEILVSPNIYKNGLCVGIPYTDEVGLGIAGALGITGGKSVRDLQVLEGLNEKDVIDAKQLVKNGIIKLNIKDTDEKVYVEVNLKTDGGCSKVIIQEKHNNFIHLESNNKVLHHEDSHINSSGEKSNELFKLKIREIIKAIEKIDPDKLMFLIKGIEMNEKVAEAALERTLGMGVGSGLNKSIKSGMISNDLINNAMMLTAAASDARMSGLSMPVMSSNGSGNHGLTTILPIVAYKRLYEVEDEKIVKALAISHLITGYIKNYTGRLSPLCGCGVAASTGASAAITWLLGGAYDQIDGTIKNMVANISGMICDGAKVGCALKLATAASTAIQSSMLAINNSIVPARNGIVAECAEETIKNLGILGTDGMDFTDKVILQIMQRMEERV